MSNSARLGGSNSRGQNQTGFKGSELANCIGATDAIFFGTDEQQLSQERQEYAIAKYCMNCSVRLECVSYGLKTEQEEGVWGVQRHLMTKSIEKLKDEKLNIVIKTMAISMIKDSNEEAKEYYKKRGHII